MRTPRNRSGRLIACIHETDSQTSRHDLFASTYTETTSSLYGLEHFRGEERLVRTDTQTPGFMRTPFEHIASTVRALDATGHRGVEKCTASGRNLFRRDTRSAGTDGRTVDPYRAVLQIRQKPLDKLQQICVSRHAAEQHRRSTGDPSRVPVLRQRVLAQESIQRCV